MKKFVWSAFVVVTCVVMCAVLLLGMFAAVDMVYFPAFVRAILIGCGVIAFAAFFVTAVESK